jgi:hypothetical protein
VPEYIIPAPEWPISAIELMLQFFVVPVIYSYDHGNESSRIQKEDVRYKK